eukprot:3232274-Rhodomonas_salina.1
MLRALVLCALLQGALSFSAGFSGKEGFAKKTAQLQLSKLPTLREGRANKSRHPCTVLCSHNAPETTTQEAAPSAKPAPGKPFHLAFPVHDLDEARKPLHVLSFYGNILGCEEGRCAPGKWIDFALSGHQIVCHWVGKDYRAPEYYNPVDGDEVPGKLAMSGREIRRRT